MLCQKEFQISYNRPLYMIVCLDFCVIPKNVCSSDSFFAILAFSVHQLVLVTNGCPQPFFMWSPTFDVLPFSFVLRHLTFVVQHSVFVLWNLAVGVHPLSCILWCSSFEVHLQTFVQYIRMSLVTIYLVQTNIYKYKIHITIFIDPVW